MATAAEVLNFALKDKGYTESPPNSNMTKFGEFYGMNGVPYCAEAVYYWLTKCNIPILKTAYTPTMAQWFADQKRGFTEESKIVPGDVIFFNFPDSIDRIQHVGLATGKWTGQLATFEANTSSGIAGSQDDGGGCFPRIRYAPEIVYIGRPDYDEHEQLPRFDLPRARTFLRKGDQGADVKTLQRDLNSWMKDLRDNKGDHLAFDFGRIDVDGVFDKETKKALQTFQMQHSQLEPDGLFGRETERVLERVRARQEAA